MIINNTHLPQEAATIMFKISAIASQYKASGKYIQEIQLRPEIWEKWKYGMLKLYPEYEGELINEAQFKDFNIKLGSALQPKELNVILKRKIAQD